MREIKHSAGFKSKMQLPAVKVLEAVLVEVHQSKTEKRRECS